MGAFLLKQKAPLLSEGLLFLAAIMMMAVMPIRPVSKVFGFGQ